MSKTITYVFFKKTESEHQKNCFDKNFKNCQVKLLYSFANTGTAFKLKTWIKPRIIFKQGQKKVVKYLKSIRKKIYFKLIDKLKFISY